MEALAPNKTLVEKAYEALLEAICCGDVRPGDRLNQDELASKLNVSRQPINSAIAMLKAQRFVQDTGKRGVVVAPIDQNLFDSIYEFRTVVEPLAVQLACQRMTSEAVTLGREIISRGKSCVQSADHAAALLTGAPSSLVSALRKVSDGAARAPLPPEPEIAVHADTMLVPPFRDSDRLGRIFRTQPPLDSRVERLQALTA